MPNLTELELQALVTLLQRTPLSLVESAWVGDFLLKHGYAPDAGAPSSPTVPQALETTVTDNMGPYTEQPRNAPPRPVEADSGPDIPPL